MALPPEKISVKRRRQDDPVDTLVLEQTSTETRKRRFTNFFFQRIHQDPRTISLPSRSDDPTTTPSDSKQATGAAAERARPGIPTIKATKPGDEIKDFVKYKSASGRQQSKPSSSMARDVQIDSPTGPGTSKQALESLQQRDKLLRRFHLTGDLSSSFKSSIHAHTRRKNLSIRPPLATFVERQHSSFRHDPKFHKKVPIDRLVEVAESEDASTVNPGLVSNDNLVTKRTEVRTFVPTHSVVRKNGHSLRDDPYSWDLESDQLADELSALAMQIDHQASDVSRANEHSASAKEEHIRHVDSVMSDIVDEFVYETYVRVTMAEEELRLSNCLRSDDKQVGVLIIDAEVEDLWEKYVNSDDEDEWDEEDEDSNAEDNPRNEYPEDEVSSDDEYGRNAYKYRFNASDDEYDESE